MYKIVLCGTPNFVAPFFEEFLKNNKYKIEFIITQKSKKKDRKGEAVPSDIAIWAKEKKLKCYEVQKIREEVYLLEKLKEIDFVLVFSFGQIIPQQFLEIPKFGWLNIHPSNLPDLRGPAPLQYALLQRLKKTSITLMKMNRKMDEGDVIAQKEFDLNSNHSLKVVLNELGPQFAIWIEEKTDQFLNNKISAFPQKTSATYTNMLVKDMHNIINEKPIEILAKIRALLFVYIFYKELKIKCFCAKISDEDSIINYKGIEPIYVQAPGKKIMHIHNFLNGV